MVTSCNKTSAIDEEALKTALKYQWEEFTHNIYPGIEKDHAEFSKLMSHLNSFIENETFFSGCEIDDCDHALFDALHPLFTQMSFVQKQKYASVSRWFNHMQFVRNQNKLYPAKKNVVISVNNLY